MELLAQPNQKHLTLSLAKKGILININFDLQFAIEPGSHLAIVIIDQRIFLLNSIN